uniref:Cadherin domain-containing protein n=1 Tax=Ficedula albicollis TaxID=59894 RepID=A0A803WBA5_FICAL
PGASGSAGCGRRQVLCLSAFLALPLARAEPIRYSVAEEAESGSLVGKLAEDAGLTPPQLSARRARLLSEDGRQHLRLDRGSGRLLVAGRLDREELCAHSATCMLPFELLLSDPLQFFRVEVTLNDVNDHSPVFPEVRDTFKIPETSETGSRFPLQVARDLDIGSNNIQAYRISPQNADFSVSYGSRSEDDKYLELVLEKPLDREEQAEMSFSVIAEDGGSPPRSGTTQVKIVILDANDNAPMFTKHVYIAKVLENMPEGSVILTVLATDQDAGINGDISYEITELVGQSDSQFVIDHRTGEIKLTKPLDFEEAETHLLSVRARDGGGLSAICKVLVEVVDVNDNAPELAVSSFSSPLPENTVPGTVVALFTVRDRDSGANGKISCALDDQLFFSLRPAYKNYYELVTVSALDRERTARYVLGVTAADAGSPPLTSTHTFTVDISDVNDNAPVFNQTSYTMYVRENNAPTVFVGAVSAADADVGLNAKVTYSLAPVPAAERPSCSCISVNSENGHVFVLRPLDYERLRQSEVTVSASDAGSPPLRANVTVRLVVLDENDNAPLVLYPAQDGSAASSELVPVSAEPGYLVTKVVAVDADSGQNSWLSYHLLRATEPGLFMSALDRERTARYVLGVTAADAGSPPLTSTHTFTVDISDVNDNAPVFNQTSYTMYVRENNAPTVFVGAVSAADADVGLNAKVTYSLAPVPAAERPSCSCISVNSENGHVFVLRPLDYERLRQSEVTVSASDAGSPPLRANVTVRLVVLDENDNAPLVLYPAQDGSAASSELVPVSAEPGYLVTKVVAVDADSGQNSWLSYHLLRATEPGLFSVAVQSGEVRLKRPVTERDSAKHKLLVLVRDNGKPPLSATAALSALLLKDFSDVRLPHGSPPTDEQGDSLTTYLIIALVFVSLLFLISSALFVARKVCKSKELKAAHVLSGAHNLHSGLADAAAAGTLPRAYCYEISLTTGSGNSEFQFLKPILPSLPAQMGLILQLFFCLSFCPIRL